MDQQQPLTLFDADDTVLSQTEQQQLAELEGIIARGLTTFVEVGAALMEIRTGRLYRQTHQTFEDYCHEHWGMNRGHANRLIRASETVANLDPQGSILPTYEQQVRPLTPLEPEQQRAIWQRAIETAPDGKVTGSHVRRIINEYRAESELIADNESEPEIPLSPLQPAVAPKMAVHYSSETPEHYTPQDILDAVVACMGTIDLDPCSNSRTLPNVPATRHYTTEDDGLSQFWSGKVFMNPPYGREIARWVDKLCSEYAAGRVTEAIALVPARTDTDWWDQLIDGYKFICFVHGRLTFIGNEDTSSSPAGTSSAGVAPFPSAIVYLGTEWGRFYHNFRSFGRIVQETHPQMFGSD